MINNVCKKYLNFTFIRKSKIGFTLIELLVVISIIGLLSSMAFYALNIARMKARDARRKADLVQIQKALLLYAYNHGGALPTSGFGYNNGGRGWATNKDNGSFCYSPYGDLEDFLDGTDPDIPAPVINYLEMGHDPKCGGCGGCDYNPGGYYYYHNGTTCATLFAHLENPTAEDLASCANTCRSLPGYGMNYCVDVRP
jgi:prepilin-type N-terminal cleavage/methylation domain-containing protein